MTALDHHKKKINEVCGCLWFKLPPSVVSVRGSRLKQITFRLRERWTGQWFQLKQIDTSVLGIQGPYTIAEYTFWLFTFAPVLKSHVRQALILFSG